MKKKLIKKKDFSYLFQKLDIVYDPKYNTDTKSFEDIYDYSCGDNNNSTFKNIYKMYNGINCGNIETEKEKIENQIEKQKELVLSACKDFIININLIIINNRYKLKEAIKDYDPKKSNNKQILDAIDNYSVKNRSIFYKDNDDIYDLFEKYVDIFEDINKNYDAEEDITNIKPFIKMFNVYKKNNYKRKSFDSYIFAKQNEYRKKYKGKEFKLSEFIQSIINKELNDPVLDDPVPDSTSDLKSKSGSDSDSESESEENMLSYKEIFF